MSKTDLEAIQKEHEKIFHQLLIGYTEDFDLKKFYDRHLGIYRKNFQNILEHYPEYFGIWLEINEINKNEQKTYKNIMWKSTKN